MTKNLLLIKEIYLEAFKGLGSRFVKQYFKAFSWFCLASYFIMLYAFAFRVSTGFAFE
ncbi:DUF6747 family protein [Aurantibacter crassamenti]|uniref:DUF6747 family protein n=1 Tax=Aurantibacter crassamenti TaxID=1837375 RepID=UPI00293D77CD|nr:DUF6747 family protein [Aurantibacter crassamenti]